MSNTSNTPSNGNPTVEELQAEIDRLNSQLGSQSSGQNTQQGTPASAVTTGPTSGPGVYREPSEGATIIGSGADPRGGTVLGFSDGTVRLINMPTVGAAGDVAEPWGSAPEGEYVQFYLDDNGNRYVWVNKDGSDVETVDNPVQARP